MKVKHRDLQRRRVEVDNPLRVLLFWTKVIVGEPDECWWWTGYRDKKGYGTFYVAKGKNNKAHIFSWILHFGSTLGLHVHHTCENESCVNPHHFELLSNKKNNELSSSPSAINKRKTHCIHGHPLFGDNLHIEPSGRRCCNTCKKESNERSRKRKAT